ncbi:Exodeoxyribonuclease VII large subunit [Caloramator quimbayensis]|uniref:Exodeoxyribonuclease 7 large subunit n=1 Tax=Caloramator quimbayensis TaxID=1147123 RepID=A0A1T4WZH5_9CLOT|nr:exodeoxyribonuclease VII large subunit [Caloramator quimbayensis]SKA82001.1 Exodeoxyribonuclease VII large subunit [Caloramator quimbayensis]
MSKQPFTVSTLTTYIKDIIESDVELCNVTVTGEISNFKYHSSGHMYFTLKDEDAKIKCVMFKGYNLFLKFLPEDGMKVIISGYISVYERDGQYQLYCCSMQKDGLGSLYEAFEKLKQKLEKEGLFDEERKRQLPLLPEKIGVITSPTGAVIRDIINVSSRRYSNVKILLYPAKVQGEGAKESIVAGLEYFNSRDDIDVIIVARGGGSIEELWAFNEEEVARAIYKSNIPVISAVGHETDFTISDFVSDIRASTPSHAAEIAVPSYNDIKYKIKNIENRLISNIEDNITRKRYIINDFMRIINSKSPANIIVQNQQYIDSIQYKLINCVNNKIIFNKNRIEIAVNKIDALNPAKILLRGYGYVENKGEIIKSVKQLSIDDKINLHLSDGNVKCRVEDILEDKNGTR